ncbi:MAG: hypothetical protein NUV54_01015 [Candidatus Taylorbacteria bacterium]|nr:hypothetical protein [Candidatus Taylorbacteria bacterium]
MKTELEVYHPPPVKFWRSFGIFLLLGVLCLAIATADWLARQSVRLRELTRF